MNKFLLIVLALFLAGPVRGTELINGIMARVNGDVITFYDVSELYSTRKKQIGKKYSGKEADEKLREARKAVLNELIDNVLIRQDFKDGDSVIPEEIIDKEVEEIITKEFKGDKKAFIAAVDQQGYTFDEFRDLKRKQIMVAGMKAWATRISDDPAEKQKLLADYLARLRKNAFIQILTEMN
jgi:hypothetical protein